MNSDSTITLRILDYMNNGLEVFDTEVDRIGTVEDFDGHIGYMMVRSNQLSDPLLYIPFSIITQIDLREVFVSETKDEVDRLYNGPPPRTVLVEERTDPDTGEDESWAVTTEPSGYDAHPIVVGEADVGELARHIAPGFQVYTAEMEDIGRIKQYDRAHGRMLVAKPDFHRHDIVVPVRYIRSVDRVRSVVTLSVGSKDLEDVMREKPDALIAVAPGLRPRSE